jgi:acetyltransferase-like isoleucine patch superfamily enzyme
MTLAAKLGKALRQPGAAWEVAASHARAYVVRVSCRVRGIRFEAGRNFRVTGRLVLKGPGRVVFGDNVTVDRVVTPWTYSADALIEVGSHCYLNGTRFGCQQLIRVGDYAILGDASISDTDFHSVRSDRHSPEAPIRVRPVVIGDNVWVATAVGILPGTTIGANSVVGYGAVCTGQYAADSVIVGNPARVVKPVPHPPGPGVRAEDAILPSATPTHSRKVG